ncbi:MAG: ribbon-helix-helix domain-containing protein [Carnobacterium alterfunditum]
MTNHDGDKKRGLATRKPLSTTLDKKLIQKLDELAKQTRIPKSKLIDEAVELLLDKHKN